MKYKHTLVRLKKIGARFYEQERHNFGICDEDFIDRATNRDTMKFFKSLGAKERVIYNNNDIRIISTRQNDRSIHIFEKITEEE